MERLPVELHLKIFCFLDHQNLATAHQVCRKWKVLASDNYVWSSLFKERWGGDRAASFVLGDSRSWKKKYEVEDRLDRVGMRVKIIREGEDYYLVRQGEIQRYLGSRKSSSLKRRSSANSDLSELQSCRGILDKILFFIGDLEVASTDNKRGRAI
ncbi:hypothetical protein G4B88_030891 [Cannabis sativa]|uniref:F-box protein n=1 Tax=Cannabis sativa TaxID=3483 RepID=A0A7J6DW71_CANSA|nr:hypothetical protein G4B88_030891 [Cannabis sativa]